MAHDDGAKTHKPYIPDETVLPEFSLGPILVGAILGIVFGSSSLYLVLKVGMTISASIPVAVISITLFRAISKAFGIRPATILENNIVQTTGSAGESIAFGVGVTMPALLILGYDMEIVRVMTVACLGGLLGILMMIPLRKGLIVREHGKLIYPEGTACAEVLKAGEKGGTNAKTVFTGFFVGFGYKILSSVLKIFKVEPEKILPFYKNVVVAGEFSPELLGVGYIIGPATGCIMMGGAVLASLVVIPLIRLFGEGLTAPLYPGTKLISEMSHHDLWGAYVLYIGAGAVAAGGIISLFSSIPLIYSAFRSGIATMMSGAAEPGSERRTERDLPMSFVVIGSVVLLGLLWLTPLLHLNFFGALLIILFGFLFVTVSSRLTGEIGSSSNPISGMTVSTLLLTCLIFVALGWTGADYRVTALSIAAVVCVAASNAGTTSQDLKTGFLVGATPRHQQMSLLVGALSSAVVIGFTLLYLNDSSTVHSRIAAQALPAVKFDTAGLSKEQIRGPERETDPAAYFVFHLRDARDGILPGKYLLNDDGSIAYVVDPGINGTLKTRDNGSSVIKYNAPKARLMSLIIDGILTQKLPWVLVLIGVFIAVVLELAGISSLPFAVGVYLPMAASTPIFVGGLIRYVVDRFEARDAARAGTDAEAAAADSESSPGVLLSSGLIAGGSIAGIVIAILSAKYETVMNALDLSAGTGLLARAGASDLVSCVAFLCLGLLVFLVGRRRLLA